MDTVFVDPAPRLAVSVAGQGELVLFLHGIRGNRRNWAGQINFFSSRFRAAAVKRGGQLQSFVWPLVLRLALTHPTR